MAGRARLRKTATSRDLFAKLEDELKKKPIAAAKPAKAKRNGGAASDDAYTAADIEVLEGLEPVRRRPGMYIGGTDEKALHHLFAEVLDNAMDEAVEGHATRIEVSFEDDGFLSVTDNGRGIPVDPHPKFKKKSALEVIMTTLHSGGKFNSKVYDTSGGLHGVGVSVVNALSEHLEVEVARGQKLYRQTYTRGAPDGPLKALGAVNNRRGTKVRFKPDPKIFGKGVAFAPARLFRMSRSKAYLFGGVEIRWSCAAALLASDKETPPSAVLHFPGGLKDFLAGRIEGQETVTKEFFTGKSNKREGHGAVEWAIAWVAGEDGFLNSYCNTVPTPDGGTHEAGLRSALVKGLRAYGELVGNKRAAQLTAEDILSTAGALLSMFIREPEFQGQTKDRLATQEATRIVETTLRDAFDHWLTGNPPQANRLLDWVVDRAEERLRRRKEKEIGRQTATRRLRLPGKLADCALSAAEGTEIFIVEGDSAGGSAKQARDRASQAVLPLRGKILNVASASSTKLADNQLHRRSGAGAWLRDGHAIPRSGPSLREGRDHDRRRRRRRPYRLAAHHLLLPGDARADREWASLSRRAAALPPEPRRQDRLRARRCAQGRTAQDGVQRQGQGRCLAVQGLGRDAAEAAQGDDHGPQRPHAAARGDRRG